MSKKVREYTFKFNIEAEIPENSIEFKEYIKKITEGKTYLGQTLYTPNGEISKGCYDKELNYFNAVGVIEGVDLDNCAVYGKSVVPYDNEDYIIKPIFKENKFKDFYLTRRG